MRIDTAQFYPLVLVGPVEEASGLFEAVGFLPDVIDGENRYPRFIKEYGSNEFELFMWVLNEVGRLVTGEMHDVPMSLGTAEPSREEMIAIGQSRDWDAEFEQDQLYYEAEDRPFQLLSFPASPPIATLDQKSKLTREEAVKTLRARAQEWNQKMLELSITVHQSKKSRS